MFGRRFKTARCVLRWDERYLLAVHSRFARARQQRWGLCGGSIEWGEGPEEAVRRELAEELDLAIGELVEVGPYRYKHADHLVFAGDVSGPITSWDDFELVELEWYTVNEISALKDQRLLHAGYELEAVMAAEQLLRA